MVKKITIVLAMVVAWGAAAPPPLHAAKVVERIIARVNSEIITMRMYQREKEKLRQQLAQDYSGPDLDAKVREEGKNLLRDLIDQSLMVQKAKDLDINVETDVVKRLDDIRQQNKLASLEDLQKEVEKSGLVWEDFKDQIRRQLLMREVIGREVASRLLLSREDARKFYEQHKAEFKSAGMTHLAEILISTEKHKPDEAKKRAEEAVNELKGGARFAEVAKKYSDAPSASDGGDVGFIKSGTMAPDIAAAVAKLDVNETSDPIETKYGTIILKVVERFSPGIPKFEEVEARVMDALQNQEMQPKVREYLTQLRKDSYIYLAPGYIDTGVPRPSDTELAKRGQ